DAGARGPLGYVALTAPKFRKNGRDSAISHSADPPALNTPHLRVPWVAVCVRHARDADSCSPGDAVRCTPAASASRARPDRLFPSQSEAALCLQKPAYVGFSPRVYNKCLGPVRESGGNV